MSILQKIIILVLNLFRVNGEVNYLSLSIVAGLIPMLIWFSVKLLTKKGPNPFAQDTRRHSELLETDLKARDKVLKNGFVAKKVPDNLDAIVIGSGIGSLSCAAILAKAGKKVLVLEQHDQAGGCCHTFYEKGFEFDTGIHYVGEMAGNSVTKFLIDQLTDGQLQWAPLDPVYDEVVIGSSPADAKTYPVLSGKGKFKDSLLEKFPNEKKAIDKFFDMIEVTQTNQRINDHCRKIKSNKSNCFMRIRDKKIATNSSVSYFLISEKNHHENDCYFIS